MSCITVIDVVKKEWLNVSGSSERSPKCRCGSWKHHWENYSGHQWPTTCSVLGCGHEAVLGAHVHRNGYLKQYIVPFCNRHNNVTELLAIKSGTVLVNANQSETCG